MNKESLFIIWWSHYGEGLDMESCRKAFYGGMESLRNEDKMVLPSVKPGIYPILDEDISEGVGGKQILKEELGVNLEEHPLDELGPL